MKINKILLTGASGFIGSYILNHCQKHDITPFSFLNDNLSDLNLNGYDTVLHLAALVHQMGGADISKYYEINVTRTLELAQKAKHAGVKHFIFMSSVKVYGEESDTVYTETTPCYPQDAYGKSKLQAEEKLQELSDRDFIVSIIRTPIVYGVGVKGNIKNLVSLIKKVPLLPLKTTHNKRSMVYIGNLFALIEHILEDQKGGIFLANDDTTLSTAEFIGKIADTLEKKLYLVNIPLFEYLLRHLKPSFHKRLYGSLTVDNSMTKERLKFKNPHSTEEGIKNMLKGSSL